MIIQQSHLQTTNIHGSVLLDGGTIILLGRGWRMNGVVHVFHHRLMHIDMREMRECGSLSHSPQPFLFSFLFHCSFLCFTPQFLELLPCQVAPHHSLKDNHSSQTPLCLLLLRYLCQPCFCFPPFLFSLSLTPLFLQTSAPFLFFGQASLSLQLSQSQFLLLHSATLCFSSGCFDGSYSNIFQHLGQVALKYLPQHVPSPDSPVPLNDLGSMITATFNRKCPESRIESRPEIDTAYSSLGGVEDISHG